MDENITFGFTYNVKTFLPNGEKDQDFSVHNLMPDEGLNYFLGKFFKITKQRPMYFTKNTTEKLYHISDFTADSILLSYIPEPHTPDKGDYGVPFINKINELKLNNKISCHGPTTDSMPASTTPSRVVYKSYDTSTNQIILHSGYENWGWRYYDISAIILERLTLYGVVLYYSAAGNFGHAYDLNNKRWYATCIILSEAMFPEPLKLEKGASIIVEPVFTIKSM